VSQRHATGGTDCFSLLDLLPTPPEQQSKQNKSVVLEIYELRSFKISLALVELCHLLLVHLVHELDLGIRK
jgi:hypothetical protein